MIKYKLTTQDMKTHNGFQWELGVTKYATEEGTEMCSNQVLHCYDSPELAVLFNPIHADISNPRIFKIECDVVNSDGLKSASKHQTLIEEISLPVITIEQKVEFAVQCAMIVNKMPKFISWANAWLDGSDRSYDAAVATYCAIDAAYRVVDAAYYAVNAAARATLISSAHCASDVAYYAADAAYYAAKHSRINFQEIIETILNKHQAISKEVDEN